MCESDTKYEVEKEDKMHVLSVIGVSDVFSTTS